jgi:dTDP-4-dehydrorhamnose 3,5-epimerase
MTHPVDATRPEEIAGVVVRPLAPTMDFRGSLAEIHRDEWLPAPRPVQWDFVVSKLSVLRGVHVHCLRWDYVIPLHGHGMIGLADLRRDKPSFGRRMSIDITGSNPVAITIPPGVAHGICAQSALSYLYGLTVLWDGSDEDLGCRYDDPLLGIPWPTATPIVLQRDLDLPDFATLSRQYAAAARPEAIAPSAPA